MSRLIQHGLRMGEPALVKGNEAIAEAAVRAGCRHFFGYPITPQSELPQYMAKRMPEVGGVYLQAESEVAAVNMVYGAASAGVRVLTSSSSPGFSLKQEGISYLVGSELPCVLVNIMRGGPGLGNLGPTQADYYQATRGGGHGDYRTITFGPGNLQELVDSMVLAYDLADKYRNPVIVIGDGVMGQMMEPVCYPEEEPVQPEKPWKVEGRVGMRPPKVIHCMSIAIDGWVKFNQKLYDKFQLIEENEQYYELIDVEDADIVMVSFGTASRICRTAMERARAEGIKVGMIRPIAVWPFPQKAFEYVLGLGKAKAFLGVELSMGQMIDDVRLAVNGRLPVHLHTKFGGITPTPRELHERLRVINEEVLACR